MYEGKHEAIISEEDWNLAQEKRKVNAYRREKVNDPTHAHILSGILKCPCCGKSLYGNIAKAHSKDKKTRYYYYCKNTVTPTGHECTFRLNIEQMEMNRMVASIISAMVSDPRFADAIKAKIGSAVDTNDLEKQLEALQAQLRQTLGTKARLERQMDGLDVNDPYYDRKISDLQRRYDEQYGKIDEVEVQIDDVQSQIRSIRQEKISGDNIYRLLLAFDQVYEADMMKNHPEINIVDFDLYNVEAFNRCENNNEVLLAFKSWESVHPLIRIIPVEWDYTMPFGILHSKKPSIKVKRLINAINKVK